tara:strand:+ start:2978 stop:4018 length:1041 start_codon:yes stop_codon:yes gene_type:complete
VCILRINIKESTMLVLGIESSCDETGLALYSEHDGLIAHLVNSQIDLFTEYGGVIPEIAARDHSVKIIEILKTLLDKTGKNLNDISLIAYTAGPGLIGSLMVGETVAKTISEVLKIELLPINHLEGHILTPGLEKDGLKPPYLCLLVSGGHTQIIRCDDYGDYEIIGETVDDACGEAFDKVGKLLNLEYPGGPKVSKLAEKGDKNKFSFPRAMMKDKNLNFSFSGLKTAVLYALEDLSEGDYPDVAASFQEAVIEVLTTKLSWAVEETGIKKLVCSGGVASNQLLRDRLKALAEEQDLQLSYPSMEFCTDNAAMIAYAGYIRKKLKLKTYQTNFARPRWPLGELYD